MEDKRGSAYPDAPLSLAGCHGKTKWLFEKIVQTPIKERRELWKLLSDLREIAGLSYALLALYRQQVKSGFVLADPLKPGKKEEKNFFDPDTGITFCWQ